MTGGKGGAASEGSMPHSKLDFVDLAGSERFDDSAEVSKQKYNFQLADFQL